MSTRPDICVTVTAPTVADLRRQRDLVSDADLVELRLDTVADPDVAAALEGRRTPVIVTCRAAWEGGSFTGSEEERRRLLERALALGADYVDVEWRAGFTDLVRNHAGRIVLSAHDFSGVPDDLPGQLRAMRSTGAGVVKVAITAHRLTDSLRLLEAAGGAAGGADGRQRQVLIAMGDAGLHTRVLAGRFGSAWTYAGSVRDVGQIGAGRLLSEFRFRSITAATALYGLVGRPIAHSVSPAMHNAAFGAAGIDGVYVPLPAADADDFVTFARAVGLRGASVTIPYKVALRPAAHEADKTVETIGALNTLRMDAGCWRARNTDVDGFLQPLRGRGVALAGRRVSILGAGGSARAVAVAAAGDGASVTVHARDRARAQVVAALVGGQTGPFPPDAGSWDVLVNCTPVGMHPRVDESPVPEDVLGGALVYDLIYNPRTTRLLRDAQAAGCQTIGGLDMLVGQAQAQFEWWTGVRPAFEVMHDAAQARLSEFNADEDHLV